MEKRTVIYDIETLSNCFTYTAIDKDTKELITFVIWKDQNDFRALMTHLSEVKGMIGFNNINFDYPVLHYMIQEREKLVHFEGDKIAKLIYKKAQSIISQEYSAVREDEIYIAQLDLFKIWHYDNRARMTSLKKLEIALNFPNVQDMPYDHTHKITSAEQVQEILDYNINDVEATVLFYEKTKDKLELRKGLLKKYGLPCLNYPDSKIGEQLMLKLYCHYTKQSEDDIKHRRTYRDVFRFKECIPEYIEFSTPEFNELLTYLRGIEVNQLKESFKYGFEYQGFTFDLGTGGIHGCIKPGVYKSTDDMVIVDADVASLYPSLGITLGLYPEHLGPIFGKIYEEGIVKPRLAAKKAGDKVMAEGGKLSANSVYGKSNSEYSFLYDPLYTLKTTLAGQLALCMLSEMLMTRVPNLTMLQINTDGLTVIIPKQYKKLYWKICKEWEERTKLVLEYVAYEQMIIRDVNNYIAVDTKGKVKYKGTFKPNHEMIKDGEYHKSLSQGIVSLAVSDYFLKDIPVEKTIRECTDIYLFCKTFNATHGWTCETADVGYSDVSYDDAVSKLKESGWEEEKEGFFKNDKGKVIHLSKEGSRTRVFKNIKKQQKTNRYFVSTNGKTFRKIKDDRIIEIEAGGTLVTIFNKYYEASMSEYSIDYDYYVQECNKIIHRIDGTEERLELERVKERERLKREKEEENYVRFCVDKVPTSLQLATYRRDWLIDKYGEPPVVKPSKSKKVLD